ncbi:hypothetical protein OKA04_12810 [Luteolibacter flavescens]|uniref:Holin n=1 Tax=Luteolibacter flavescens TaxID=1859460 RepID=A0ABT3FPW4_9BACT|nr:hypothetical protein [Luteolibacter flavescens]MCW1885612.1 hypothetical protein [Luteolibacter flavescens]
MNETSSPHSNQTQLNGELISVVPPLWRSQLVRVLEVLGVVAMFLGGAEFLSLLNSLPDGVAPQWAFLIGGVVNKSARPAIEFFGDWFDDGELNKSFKIGPTVGLIAVLCALSVGLTSCQHLAGTQIGFDENGALVVTPPTKPVVIPLQDGK